MGTFFHCHLSNSREKILFVGWQDGEQLRGGAALPEAGQVPAAPARQLRAVAQVRPERQVVRVDGQGQPAQCLAHALRRQHLPGAVPFGCMNLWDFDTQVWTFTYYGN